MNENGASDISRAHSAGDTSPFSGADHGAAAIMADAFSPVEEAEDQVRS
jgi:hypothetical protein